MGNKVRGQIDLQAGDKAYTLQFTANAMCELEAKAGLSISEFMANLQAAQASGRVKMLDLRLLIWAGLTENHPELTLKQAGQIINDLGGMAPAMAVLGEGLAAASGGDGDQGNAPATAV